MADVARACSSHGASPGTLDAAAIYCAICENPGPFALVDPFMAHVLACAISVGVVEAAEFRDNVSEAIGLDKDALARIIENWLPEARHVISLDAQSTSISLDEEETQVRELLERYRVDDSDATSWITSIVTRRSMAPRHLWQDLGLFNRDELTRLLKRWHPGLASQNIDNMKWKKFFYRKLCELEGFSLCAAPTCRECGDFNSCFGDEGGESALARLTQGRRA
ncbi:nitrogen fixation protein NifQ [Methylocystis sp. WRRC1]|uniref:nitrogen fixation protein NifQ n=1 Tax=Methylocystis sp. WRRC1 TaxID=1732014 RepID=UPI001D14AF74|nr:nitrogen fixation protein NifQ [Methylocystis sp. WRRC1]MCC3246368.1 nitrogen fixation protein NifQ [Methylocystis sp. WRRC1]